VDKRIFVSLSESVVLKFKVSTTDDADKRIFMSLTESVVSKE
jgi:hypothetical protein